METRRQKRFKGPWIPPESNIGSAGDLLMSCTRSKIWVNYARSPEKCLRISSLNEKKNKHSESPGSSTTFFLSLQPTAAATICFHVVMCFPSRSTRRPATYALSKPLLSPCVKCVAFSTLNKFRSCSTNSLNAVSSSICCPKSLAKKYP